MNMNVRADLPVDVGHLSSQNHPTHFTLHFQTLERSPLGFCELHGLRNNPLLLQVHLNGTDKYLNDSNVKYLPLFSIKRTQKPKREKKSASVGSASTST